MEFKITDRAKKKLALMKEQNIPIVLYGIPVGWNRYNYKIVSVKQKKYDNVYNVDGIEIIVTAEVDRTLLGAKIDFGGFFTKDYIVTPRYS